MADYERKLYILDGSHYVFRAFYGNQFLTASDGTPTGAVFAFTRMMQRLIAQERPHWMAVAFDVTKESFRKTLYSEYKANRSAPPDDLVAQVPGIHAMVRAHNIPVFTSTEVEADDLIASLARKARQEGMQVVIVSADKDLMQLLDEGTVMLDTMKNVTFTVPDVVERFQVPPSQVVEVLALSGDTSDNVPGVPGIGEKTAGKLIKEFGTLENLLANIDKVSGDKRRQSLRDFADQARMSRTLVTLKEDCAVDLDLDALVVGEPDYEALEQLYRQFEFITLLKELTVQKDKPVAPKPVPRAERTYRTVLTASELDEVLAEIRAAGSVALHIEMTGPSPHDDELAGVALAWTPHAGVYIPMQHRYLGVPAHMSLDAALEKLRPLLEDAGFPKSGFRVQNVWIVLRRYGLELQGVVFDAMLASYLVDASRKSDPLEDVVAEQLSYDLTKYSDVAGRGQKQLSFDMLELEAATPYAAERADAIVLLRDLLAPQLAEHDALQKLHDTLELPLSRVLARMAMHGVLVDVPLLKQLSGQYDIELVELQRQIWELAGGEFNINSPIQLRKVLFDDLALPVVKRTKQGPSTDQSVLEELSEQHDLPALIVEFRSFSKLKSTYVDALPTLVGRDGRIHTDFNQAIAATGRLSSSNPNLQNIPIRTERGREIRRAFVPPEDWTLLSCDYSQVELRILAHLTGDDALVAAFQSGQDVHRRTAAEIFGVSVEEVTDKQRAVGKTINFGVVYGMGASRLSRDLGITRQDADRYISAYFDRYGAVRAYFDGLVGDARTLGYATTMFGRRRPIPELSSSRHHLRAFGERTAINTPIQGTAADIIKLAMLEVQERIVADAWPAQMILQVHDELVFEVRDDALEAFTEVACKAMREVVELRVPLVVDTGIGKTWFDCK